jgi:hypothetical protein
MIKIDENKILLVRTAWMKYYEGRANIDIPRSGAKYILQNKKGGELNNFKNRNGKYYGYIPFVGSVNITNLGAKATDELIKGITVVFCATHPVEKGMRVVGWYENATVYRNGQSNNVSNWFFAEAAEKSVKRIDADNRFCNIPDTFGRSASFFFSLHPEKKSTLNKLIAYIESDGKIESIQDKKKTSKTTLSRQVDVETRMKVEKSAIDTAVKYYQVRYGKENVKSVEKDNVGWDLEINTGSVTLKVEVKGLSGSKMAVELTPNEFKALNKKQENYFLFIVTDALSKKPNFEVFSCLRKSNILIGHKKTELTINRVIGARIN